MGLSYDLNELYDFVGKIGESYERETEIMTATQEVARVLHSELLKRTPIITGNLRKNWSSGKNLQFIVQRVDGGYLVELVNEAKNDKGYIYAWDANYKPRENPEKKKNQFFLEKSVSATEEQMLPIIKKHLTEWWGDLF